MIATTREIAKATGTSLQTVITTLKIFRRRKYYKKKNWSINVKP